jgi:hypothetical protein
VQHHRVIDGIERRVPALAEHGRNGDGQQHKNDGGTFEVIFHEIDVRGA